MVQIALFPLIFPLIFRKLPYNRTELAAVTFYYSGIVLMIYALTVFILRHVFGLYMPMELNTLVHAGYLGLAFTSFLNHIPIFPRILKLSFALFLIAVIRIYVIPLLIGLILPMSLEA